LGRGQRDDTQTFVDFNTATLLIAGNSPPSNAGCTISERVMLPDFPTSKAGIFQGYPAFLSKRGLKFSKLLAEVGLTLEDVADPAASLPLAKVVAIFERAAGLAGDPCLGLHWGEAFPVGASGVFGYAIANARTLRDAMEATERYLQLVMYPANIAFSDEDGLARLSWTMPLTDVVSVQFILMSTTATLLRLRSVAGPGWQPFAVEFMFRELPCAKDMRRVLGPTIRFDQLENAIVVDSATLDRGSGAGDTRLYTLVSELGERMLQEQAAEASIVMQTQKEILEALRRGRVTLELVAEALEISPRLLQTKLSQNDTNFDALYQEARKQLAVRLLRDTDKSLSEIALELGFSELSSFTRAFKVWFGKETPPTVYRRQLRENKKQ
jgi:AraC-like DNA-binding protein